MKLFLILVALTVSLSIAGHHGGKKDKDKGKNNDTKCAKLLGKLNKCQKKGWVTEHSGYSCNNKPGEKPMKGRKAKKCKKFLDKLVKKSCHLTEPPCPPILCSKKDVRIVAIYQVDAGRTGPPYDMDITVTGIDYGATLQEVMEKAQKEGKFTYDVGMHVTTINGIEANAAENEHWEIVGGLVPSSYVPKDGEKVLFRLRTWDDDHEHEDEDEHGTMNINIIIDQ